MGKHVVGNKLKRAALWAKEKQQNAKDKSDRRAARAKKRTRQQQLLRDGGSIGEVAESVVQQRTLESTRETEPTTVAAGDAEVLADETDDEFAAHECPIRAEGVSRYRVDDDGEPLAGFAAPKVLVTTRPRPSRELFRFVGELLSLVPNAYFYPRRHFSVQQICGFATNRGFSHVLVLSEKERRCNGLVLSKLPAGPTAFFKVSNVQVSPDLKGAGRRTAHQPEVILNNFTTRLGRRVARLLGSLFYAKPAFQGRQAVTFHNQRDYVFVRHHRYIFEQGAGPVAAQLQELGPRFTLRLRWLQDGTFDTKFGRYEWLHRRKQMDVSRRKFHL